MGDIDDILLKMGNYSHQATQPSKTFERATLNVVDKYVQVDDIYNRYVFLPVALYERQSSLPFREIVEQVEAAYGVLYISPSLTYSSAQHRVYHINQGIVALNSLRPSFRGSGSATNLLILLLDHLRISMEIYNELRVRLGIWYEYPQTPYIYLA